MKASKRTDRCPARRAAGWLAWAPVTALAGAAPPVTVYDAAADFYVEALGDSAWRYGWSAALGGEFQPSKSYPSLDWVDRWAGRGEASVGRNGTARLQSGGTAVIPPGTFVLHPGSAGEYAVTRWTAPASGRWRLDAVFDRRDHAYPTTTDVHVLRNGAAVFDAAIDRQHARAPFRSELSLRNGDTVDFAVGWGANRSWNGDATGLHAVFTWQAAAKESDR